jgi:hypothetical protein
MQPARPGVPGLRDQRDPFGDPRAGAIRQPQDNGVEIGRAGMAQRPEREPPVAKAL